MSRFDCLQPLISEKTYVNAPHYDYETNGQGMNEEIFDNILSKVLYRQRDPILVEFGVWKGGSTILMAKILRERNINAKIIAVEVKNFDRYADAGSMDCTSCSDNFGIGSMYASDPGNQRAGDR